MVNGPRRSDPSRGRIGHLRLVPSEEKRSISLSPAILRITNQIEPPMGFKIFIRVEFATCEELAKPESEALLRDAIKEIKRRILRNPNYLTQTSENFRASGIETVVFTFKLSARGVALNITGKVKSGAFVETGDIPLISTKRR